MAEFSDSTKEAPNMADLLEYFEARSRSLDDEGHPILDASTLQFISLIRFNGIPILPPVLTESKREEMQTYKHAAVKVENKTRAKRREDMHSKVQSIVAGVEERRAAKQAEKSKNKSSPSGTSRRSANKDMEETVTRLSSTKSFTESGKQAPPEITINVPVAKQMDKYKSGKSSTSTTGVSGSPKSKPSNYKSLGKLGVLNKQKSLSSQHLERTSSAFNQTRSESDKSTSPQSGGSAAGLLPHPPVGRPPSRNGSMRQSASTPDLRNIDVGIEAEDLKKPLPSRSLSPKGGRPQSVDAQKDSPKHTGKGKEKDNVKVDKNKPDKKPQSSPSTDSPSSKVRSKTTEVQRPVKEKIQTLRNPLETLEKELVKQEEAEKSQIHKYGKSDVRSDLDPIQAAAAELFPYPISEEEALATLDSLQADFASLEQLDSLPNDYNGIPLNSVKEQQIIHMLTKLSKALNIEDTLASTTSSNASNVYQGREGNLGQGASVQYYRTDTNGATSAGHGEPHDQGDMYDDGSINVTNDSSVTGPSQGSAANTSTSSRGHMSPTGSSILSSASSVGASRSRMSPKSLKNTVHFSSFVTEISTSASQSYEDKISIRKLDITPKNSENFEESENSESKNVNSSRSGLGPGTSHESGPLLNKVALSPSIDSSSGSPGIQQGQGHPLDQSYVSQDGELNTSDKENEFSPSVQNSSSDSYQNSRPSSRTQHVLNVYTANIPEGPIGENHPAVVKTSVKSDISESSTLKGSRERILTEENLSKYSKLLEAQYYMNKGSPGLDIYTHGTNSSTSSMQEEITRSYLMHQNRPEKDLIGAGTVERSREVSPNSTKGVSVVLQPVLPPNCQNSLNVNRSMLQDEEQIRSNLQRVLLEDSDDDDSSEDDVIDQPDIEQDQTDMEQDQPEAEQCLTESELQLEPVDDREDMSLEPPVDDKEDSQSNNVPCDNYNMVDEGDSQHTHNESSESRNDHDDSAQNLQKAYKDYIEEKEIDTAVNDLDNGDAASDSNTYDVIKDDEYDNKNNVEHDTEIHEVPVRDTDPAVDDIQVTEVQAEGEEVEEEEEGKAEHIQKYLTHVHEQSMQHDDDSDDDDQHDADDGKSDSNFDIASLIQSFTSTLQNMNHLSQEDLFRIQAEQFELLQKKLIEQQRAQLEELFVSQRREQLALEKEIETYQHKIQGPDDVETLPLPDTHRAPMSDSLPDPNQAWQFINQQPIQEPLPIQNGMPVPQTTYPSQPVLPVQPPMSSHHPLPMAARSPPFCIQPVPTVPYQQNLNTSIMSHNTSYSTIPYSDIHAVLPLQHGQGHLGHPVQGHQGQGHIGQGHLGQDHPAQGHPGQDYTGQGYIGQGLPFQGHDPNTSHLGYYNQVYNVPPQNTSVISMPPPKQTDNIRHRATKKKSNNQSKTTTTQSSNPYIYPTSPSLSQNPVDRDDASDVSSFARATPKQLVFSNQSTPVPVPKVSTHRPVMHSPAKKPSQAWQAGKPIIPEKVFDPRMQPKFDRVSATVKGYLTRRLLKTHKVQEIIKTINDTRNFAFSFQAETPIKQGTFTREDRILLERIVAQLQAALLDIHEIFFMIPVTERMAIIASSRMMEHDQYLRDSKRSSLSVTQSQPRLSKATLKARERKKMAQLAEESVFGSTEFRPKSAPPPTTSSPHRSTDISGPLRRHYHSLFVRALRPLQGQVSPIRPESQISVREMKERPKSASDRVKVKPTGVNNKTKKNTAGTKSTKTGSGPTQTNNKQQKTAPAQQKTAPVQPKSKKMDKAWR